MSIAKSVYEMFNKTGQLIIPRGQKGAAVSLPRSSRSDDPRRSLHIVFEDGSDLAVEIGSARLNWSDAGDMQIAELDAMLAAQRG